MTAKRGDMSSLQGSPPQGCSPGSGSRRLVGLLAIGLSLAACNRDEATDAPAPVDTVPAADARTPQDTTSVVVSERPSIECEGLETSILAVPATRESVRGEFGVPDSTIVTTEPNRHIEGAIDSLFVLRYPGLRVRLRKPPDGRDLPEQVRITETGYLRYPELGIGAESSEIVQILGEPTERNPSSLVYDCGMAAEQPVTFHLRNGVVESIGIDHYVD